MKTWRYSIPNVNSQGWAILFLDEAGCFAALSDWGNVAYRWHPRGLPEGQDLRQFLIGCDSDYLSSKLGQNRREYDPDATKKAIRRRIIERRREGTGDKARTLARVEWGLVDDDEMGDTLESFQAWHNETRLESPEELYCTRYVSEVTSFMEHAWPRLREVIQAELMEQTLPKSS